MPLTIAQVQSSVLPTGAATSAKQPALGTAGTPSADVISVQGEASMTPLKVDGSAVTQPVSGTVAVSGTVPVSIGGTVTVSGTVTANAGTGTLAVSAASLPLPSGASTSAKQPALGVAGTPSSDVLTVQGTASMTALKVDGSGVTQPVSGTVAVSGTIPVSGTVTANQGGTWTVQPGNTANTTAWKVDGSAVTQPVSGTVGISGTVPVSGTVTANIGTSGSLALDATLTGGSQQTKITDGTHLASVKAASTAAVAADTALVVAISPNNTVPVSLASTTVTGTVTVSGTVTANAGTGTMAVSAASLPLPTGAALDASVTGLQVAQGSTTSGEKGTLVQGAVTTGAPAYTTAQTSPLSLTTAGALRVDASATTQPVSGTVTANQGGTWTVQPGNTPNTTAWKVDGSAVTQPVSGTVTANAGTGTMAVSAASLPLPSGAATSANQSTLGSQTTKVNDGTNTAAVKAASTAAAATDPALVVAVSPNNTVPVNYTQVAGSSVSTAATGVQKVGVVGNAGAIFDGATGATAPANAILHGATAASAAPSLTAGNMAALSVDLAGILRAGAPTLDTTTGDTGAHTATFNGATQTNTVYRGVIVTTRLGTVSGTTPTMTQQFQWSPDGGTTFLNLGAATGTATATNNTLVTVVAPVVLTGLTTGATQTALVIAPLPRTWRMVYTITGTTPSFTFTAVNVNYTAP
jgi:hypothetical protein